MIELRLQSAAVSTSFSVDLDSARNGDRAALERVIKRCSKRLDGIAKRQLGSRLAARVRVSDLVQSAYLDVVQGIATFEGRTEEEFVGWMGRILGNNTLDKARFFTAECRAEIADAEAQDVERPAVSPTPSQAAIASEELLRLHRAMDELSDEQRLVLQLKVAERLSHEEISARLGRSVMATRSLLARARANLLLEIDRGGDRA